MNKKLRAQLIKISHRFKIRKKDLSKKLISRKTYFKCFRKDCNKNLLVALIFLSRKFWHFVKYKKDVQDKNFNEILQVTPTRSMLHQF